MNPEPAPPRRGAPAAKSASRRAGAAPREKLPALLRELRQGDLISVGAVSLVGRGPSAATEFAAEDVTADQLWAVTVESDVGWYAILSGPCDIERSPDIEPCVAISPVRLVPPERYQQLRRGSSSPREFPLPADKLAKACGAEPGGFCPVVDARFITSLDKTALLHRDVDTLRPLTGPQQKRFGLWIGNRFARPAHPGEIEDNVLGRLTRIVKRLAGEYHRNAPRDRSPEVRLVGAATEWLLTPGDRVAAVTVVVSEATCREAGLYDTTAGEIDEAAVRHAAKKLAGALRGAIRGAIRAGDGYVVRVEPTTLDGMSAADYLALEPWSWGDEDDPLE